MPEQTQTEKPKPCCVCKPEKEARDQCLLINGQESGKCDDMITQYKKCMKGYGFDI
ncbi:CYFA0S26e00848g1_1 [Cyberlindnera fabianii]|uniref:CYFA0S26e00848g1_1 n=1 Tax=Cyberlindnera fabianii TaxID=36022 RepID=A0A061BBY0_CYBFA|nr:CYFA0S26e00848g1_1 [Cyberlindnera fabianii]